MILFGWKTKPKVHGTLKKKCRKCKKNTVHGIITLTEWFTLYMIPLIPYSKQLFARCARCFADFEFKGPAKKHLLAQIKAAEL